jgi:hypothetical protein
MAMHGSMVDEELTHLDSGGQPWLSHVAGVEQALDMLEVQ